tara:strand:+ start:17 stop:1027 length:1011 start_codon:yes stop_codon:yes gene_type:complete
MIIYSVILITLNIFILFSFQYLSKTFKLEDKGDGIRKFQKNPVSLLGGSLILFNILLIIFLDYSFKKHIIFANYFETNRELFAFVFGIISFYCIGLFDDKYRLSANYKLFISAFFIFIFILIDDNLGINFLRFSFFEHVIELKSFSIFFTLLCFLLFINALNMFDGINGQVGFYCILIFSIIFSKNIIPEFCLILIISLFFFLILNLKGKVFLGESGVLILAFIISYIFVKSNSIEKNIFFADEIFMIMALPGIDMFRLFIIRIYNGKNPFSSDMNHIHHLILKYFSRTKTFLIIFSYVFATTLLYFVIDYKLIYIIVYILVYLLIVFSLMKKLKN